MSFAGRDQANEDILGPCVDRVVDHVRHGCLEGVTDGTQRGVEFLIIRWKLFLNAHVSVAVVNCFYGSKVWRSDKAGHSGEGARVHALDRQSLYQVLAERLVCRR